MLVEPPGPHVPARYGLSVAGTLRLALAAAALLLAVTSRGDALVLAAALALATWRPLPVLAIAGALAASSWRWGSTSLEAIAGAQAVLGPAGWVRPTAAAGAAWLAAAALVLGASRGTRARLRGPDGPDLEALGALVLALAGGAAAAVVVAGPAPGGDLWIRVVATIAGAAVAVAVALLRGRTASGARLLDLGAVVCGAGALFAASADALSWSGVVATDELREGAAVALATTAIVAVAVVVRTVRAGRSPAPGALVR